MAFLRMSGLALAAVLGLSLPIGQATAMPANGLAVAVKQARRRCALGVRTLPLLVDWLGLAQTTLRLRRTRLGLAQATLRICRLASAVLRLRRLGLA
jgi:hypothetical protein